MAIDTAHKRMSMLRIADGVVAALGPPPDGSVDGNDRAFYLDLYGGNTLEAPSTIFFKKTLGFLGTKVGKRQQHYSATKG